MAGRAGFPLGQAITRADLESDPHPLLARLRSNEPVSWLSALNGWLVTRRDLALRVMRDAVTFTVDDPRFSTARVVGPSMLSLDGAEHARHRAPFAPGFNRAAVSALLGAFAEAQADSLVERLRPAGAADLRRALAGPLAVTVIAKALGLAGTEPATVLSWYLGIVGAVSALTGQPGGSQAGPPDTAVAGGAEAFASLSASLRDVIVGDRGSLLAQAADGGLRADEVISNAAVLMFGAIETTEGMIANTLVHLLASPEQLTLVRRDRSLVPAAVEESLRLEPAAALVDRYATADVRLAGADIQRGDLVSVSLAGTGRDPAVFTEPDVFDVRRPNVHQHLAFAHGPHFCLGVHVARLEAVAAVQAALTLPGLRLDPRSPCAPRGLVFRKPPELRAAWDAGRPAAAHPSYT
jgi:cytochrome P450